mmetsp:Transcript_9827/g.59799  ORF Transcript_9827/g.59799 Transcript_9827/m.59799 type:complete len:440 (-) Transcript_9827:1330-2649(-)
MRTHAASTSRVRHREGGVADCFVEILVHAQALPRRSVSRHRGQVRVVPMATARTHQAQVVAFEGFAGTCSSRHVLRGARRHQHHAHVREHPSSTRRRRNETRAEGKPKARVRIRMEKKIGNGGMWPRAVQDVDPKPEMEGNGPHAKISRPSSCTHVGLPTQREIHQQTQAHQHGEQSAHVLSHAAIHVHWQEVRRCDGDRFIARKHVLVLELQLQRDEVSVTDETQVLQPIDPHRNVLHVKTTHQHDGQHRYRRHGLSRLHVLIQGSEQETHALRDQGGEDDRAQVRQEDPTVALQTTQPVQQRHHDRRRDAIHRKVRQGPRDVVCRQLVHAARPLLADHPKLVGKREQCRKQSLEAAKEDGEKQKTCNVQHRALRINLDPILTTRVLPCIEPQQSTHKTHERCLQNFLPAVCFETPGPKRPDHEYVELARVRCPARVG